MMPSAKRSRGAPVDPAAAAEGRRRGRLRGWRSRSGVIAAIEPVRWRSSGMRATPRARAARGDQPGPTGRLAEDGRSPAVGARVPAMRSASAAWPLPETPARPVMRPPREGRGRRRAGPGRRRSRRRGARGAPGPRARRGISGGGDLGADHQAGELVAVGVARSRRSPTRRPWRRTRTRSETAITSRSLWLMKTMERPSATARRRVRKSASVSCGVSTAVGSSRIRMRASR